MNVKIKKQVVLLILAAIMVTSACFLAGQMHQAGGAAKRPETETAASEPPEPLPPEALTAGPEEAPMPPPEPDPPPAPVMATAHFARDEYQCDCAGYCGGWPCEMNPALLDKIEALRCACGSPVIITSGVRCEARNDEVGGVPWSFHKRGDAADLYCLGVPVGDLAQMAQALGMNVLPYYGSGYIHVEI